MGTYARFRTPFHARACAHACRIDAAINSNKGKWTCMHVIWDTPTGTFGTDSSIYVRGKATAGTWSFEPYMRVETVEGVCRFMWITRSWSFVYSPCGRK
eukprot:2984840-Pleurochrysis_carterae.AAC.1